MYSFYEIFPDHGDLGGFFCGGRVLIFEIIEMDGVFFFLKGKG